MNNYDLMPDNVIMTFGIIILIFGIFIACLYNWIIKRSKKNNGEEAED